jgi:hypothetical protein
MHDFDQKSVDRSSSSLTGNLATRTNTTKLELEEGEQTQPIADDHEILIKAQKIIKRAAI